MTILELARNSLLRIAMASALVGATVALELRHGQLRHRESSRPQPSERAGGTVDSQPIGEILGA
ncbi:MAG TPA: hypothetical protein VGD80_20495 [Kofleriaceae bacterium]